MVLTGALKVLLTFLGLSHVELESNLFLFTTATLYNGKQ
jgi:hypothetical protein